MAGSSMPIRMAMMAITTNNSISVNAERTGARRMEFPPGRGLVRGRTDFEIQSLLRLNLRFISRVAVTRWVSRGGLSYLILGPARKSGSRISRFSCAARAAKRGTRDEILVKFQNRMN